MKRDEIYHKALENIEPFEFNRDVALVFDDMAERSIPFYKEVQHLIVCLAESFFQDNTHIIDYGCSTGTTLLNIGKALYPRGKKNGAFIGIDYSQDMCTKALEKIEQHWRDGLDYYDVRCTSIEDSIQENVSVAIMNYTLQFIDPLKRKAVIASIYNSLVPGGVFIVSNKTAQTSTDTSRIFQEIYYGLKKENGYSLLEIAQKREALENVLIPYTVDEEISLYRSAGFHTVDIFFSWMNFTSYLCVKKD